ncbi:putative ribonuclease H-like domain-containing protein [Tanacetum coccineum]
MTMRTKPDVDTLSIDDLYNNLRVFEQEIQGASKTSSSAQNVAFVSQSKSSTNKVKSGFTGAYSTCTPSTSSTNILEKEALAGFADEVIYSLFAKQSEDWDLLHEDLEQIDDLDIEEMDINWQIAMIAIRMKKFYKKTGRRVRVDGKAPVGFDKKKLECFNCHNTGHFARECTAKGTHDGKKKRDSFYQHQEAGKQEKNQMGLLTMDDGIVNWGEHTKDEETNHALMAISSSSEVSLCSKTCIDSYNTLKTLCDEQMNQLGDQEAQILAYSKAVKKIKAQLVTFQKQQLSLNEKLTFQANEIYEKDEKLKKYRRIGMKAIKEKEQLQKTLDSWKDSSKNLWRLIRSGIKFQENNWLRVAKPVWTNANRVNHANQFVPKPVQLNAGRAKINSVRPNINTDLDSQYLPGPQTALVLKDHREIGDLLLRPQQVIIGDPLDQTPIVMVDQLLLELIIHSRTWVDRMVIFDSDLRAHDGNKDQQDIDEFKWGICFLWRKEFEYNEVFYNSKKERYLTESQQENEASSTATSEDNPKILAFRIELEAIAQKHLGTVPKNNSTSTLLVNSGSELANTEGVVTDFNSLPTEIEEELLQFKLQRVWVLVDLPHEMKVTPGKRVLTMMGFLLPVAKMEAISLCLNNLPLLCEPDHPKKVYKVSIAFVWTASSSRAWDKKDIMLVQVYVDDIIFGSTKKSWCDEFEALMKSRFQMSSMGELTFFLGLQVKQNKEGIFISQDKYVAEILKKFDLVSVKTAITPMETKVALTKDEEAVDVDVHLYRSMIGSLMYLTASRPDIMFAVCACSRFQVTPKTSHLNAVKRIFKYLKGKPNLGLWYPRESPFDLEAFSDSDYGGSNLDRKSTTGGCQFLGQRLISWQCKKQTIVATSTTEAEYVAAANCCGQVLWVQNQLLDYGFNFMNTKIHIDNESTICIVKNPVYHSKTKHIEIRHHFIRDCYEKKLISVEKIHTDLNVADLLTKPFDGPRFNYLVTATAKTLADGTLELHATIDTIVYIIIEASIRNKLQLAYASGITMLPNNEIFEGMGHMGLVYEGQVEEDGRMEGPGTIVGCHKTSTLEAAKHSLQGLLLTKHKEVSTGAEEVEGVNTGSVKVSNVSVQVSTDSINKSIPSPDKGQREGKAPMIIEEASKMTKEQILQEEASLAEAIRLDTLEKEEKAKQVHLDSLLAQRLAEEEELNEQQKQRRAQELKIPINLVPVAMKSPSIATYKIIKQGERVVYQIVREDRTDIVYINFGSMLEDITRDDLTKLYRIVMNRYGMNGPEDELRML